MRFALLWMTCGGPSERAAVRSAVRAAETLGRLARTLERKAQ